MGCSTRQYTYRLKKWGALPAVPTRAQVKPLSTRRVTQATNSTYGRRATDDPQSPVSVASAALAQNAAKGSRPEVCKDMDETALSSSQETDTEAVDIEDEEADAGESDAPTPWPESWYEGGMDLGLQEFASKVMAECLSQNPEASDDPEMLHRPMAAAQSTQTDATDQRSSPDGPSPAAGPTPRARPVSLSHSNKRRISEWDGDDDGAEDQGNPKRRQGMEPPWNDATRGPFYACPYQKRYPAESPVCGLPHGSRREYGWDSVSRVK